MQLASAMSVAGGGGDTSARVMSAAHDIFGVTTTQLCSSERGDASLARWAVAYVLMEQAGWSAARVGRLLGKHHTAVLYGHRRASEMRRNSEAFYNALTIMEDRI